MAFFYVSSLLLWALFVFFCLCKYVKSSNFYLIFVDLGFNLLVNYNSVFSHLAGTVFVLQFLIYRKCHTH